MRTHSDTTNFPTIRMGLRAPRVAIAFRGDSAWHYWCRLAIHAATSVWGGSGFILIPYTDDGDVDPTLLQAASAYDPDYVTLLQINISQFEQAYPGILTFTSDVGEAVTADRRKTIIESCGDSPINDTAGHKARQKIVAACNPYRRRLTPSGDLDEQVTLFNPLSPGDERAFTLVSDIPEVATGSRLSCPEDWSGPIGVAVAARCGVAKVPRLGDKPELDDEKRHHLLRWLFGTEGSGRPAWQMVLHENAAVSVDEAALPTAFDATTHGLVTLQRQGPWRSPRIALAIGDAAEDFALAFAWDRIYGRGIWLPSEISPIGDSEDSAATTSALRLLVSQRSHRDGGFSLVSTSIPRESLESVACELRMSDLIFLHEEDRERNEREKNERVAIGGIDFGASGVRQLAVDEDWDQRHAVPVVENQEGTRTMMTPPPAPDVTHPDLARCRSLRWHVDIEFIPSRSPRGRGFDGHSFIAPDENAYMTWVRSARDGISFESHRWDFIGPGDSRLSQLARPRLRDLSLFEWASALTEQKGNSIQLSDAGLRVSILSRLWGSRDDMIDAIAGDMLPILRSFIPEKKRTRDAYPNGEGVVLSTGGPEGYLTLEGMVYQGGPKSNVEWTRNKVDDLLARTAMYRGLVLNCAICNRLSFIVIDLVSQANQCPRCGSVNQLRQELWRLPFGEPRWHYDLHPVVRELIRSDGEMPLLLARYLRSKSRRYTDTPEFEVCTPGRGRVAEADLLALSDEKLIVAEAKKISYLGKGRREIEDAARKRIFLADALGADELVFATSKDKWDNASLRAVTEVHANHSWQAGAPKVRVITGLGRSSVMDHVLT